MKKTAKPKPCKLREELFKKFKTAASKARFQAQLCAGPAIIAATDFLYQDEHKAERKALLQALTPKAAAKKKPAARKPQP